MMCQTNKMLSINEERKMNSIRQIEVLYNKQLVGCPALTEGRLYAFEYSVEWFGEK